MQRVLGLVDIVLFSREYVSVFSGGVAIAWDNQLTKRKE